MWSTSNAIRQIRTFHQLSQKKYSDLLQISTGYISLLETGRKKPSKQLLQRISFVFDLSYTWLETGRGEPFKDEGKNRKLKIQIRKPATQKALLAASALLSTTIPLASVGLLIGIAANEVITKMQSAYEAKNTEDLAKNCLGVDRSTISRWVKNNHIPPQYIRKTVSDTKISEAYLTINEKRLEDFIHTIAIFATEQADIFKNKETDSKQIRQNLINFLSLEEWDKAVSATD